MGSYAQGALQNETLGLPFHLLSCLSPGVSFLRGGEEMKRQEEEAEQRRAAVDMVESPGF